MSALGHVWTAPWQELSDVLQHWSGAVARPMRLRITTAPAYLAARYQEQNAWIAVVIDRERAA